MYWKFESFEEQCFPPIQWTDNSTQIYVHRSQTLGFLFLNSFGRVPTPVAVLISAAVFALAHLTPGQFPQLFALGKILWIIYVMYHHPCYWINLHSVFFFCQHLCSGVGDVENVVELNAVLQMNWKNRSFLHCKCRGCVRTKLCSNSQPHDLDHHTRTVELGCYYSSYRSPGKS